MQGGPVFSARIKYAGRGGPARVVRALCGPGLNGLSRPPLPPLILIMKQKQIQAIYLT